MKYFVLFFSIILLSCNNSKKMSNLHNQVDIVGNYKIVFTAEIDNKEIATKNITINFNSNGKVNGNNSCNNFSGSYTVDENKLSFGMLMQTKMFCQENTETESIFMRNLSEVDGFKIQKDMLILLRENTHLIEAKKQ